MTWADLPPRTRVTVVHKGRLCRARTGDGTLGRGYWFADCGSGPVWAEEEHLRWIRGHLRLWWPPHRKRGDALLTAAALGPEPATPPYGHALRINIKGLMMRVDERLRAVDAHVKKIERQARAVGRSVTIRKTWRL